MIKVGSGFDFHAFDYNNIDDNKFNNKHITLCGIVLEHRYSLLAHSDGDVALHAITDALFGTIAAGSIGQFFPNTDPQWYNAQSTTFVKRAASMIAEASGIIINIDVTIICQEPKIMQHTIAMRRNVANILNIDVSNVSIKATTTEGLMLFGNQHGVAAQAICLVKF